MAIAQTMCSSFKKDLLQAIHDFTASTGDVFKMALYTSAATLGASTAAYSASNEVSGTGYTAGGKILSQVTPVLSGTTAFVDFADSVWEDATLTARGALIYNSSKSNKAVAVIDFGADISSTGGDFTVQMPAADATNAIIRVS